MPVPGRQVPLAAAGIAERAWVQQLDGPGTHLWHQGQCPTRVPQNGRSISARMQAGLAGLVARTRRSVPAAPVGAGIVYDLTYELMSITRLGLLRFHLCKEGHGARYSDPGGRQFD